MNFRNQISKGNHVKFACFVLLAVSEEAKTCLQYFFPSVYNETLDSVFVISRIIKVSVRVISFSLRLRLITPILTLIILDITTLHPTVVYNHLLTVAFSDFIHT